MIREGLLDLVHSVFFADIHKPVDFVFEVLKPKPTRLVSEKP